MRVRRASSLASPPPASRPRAGRSSQAGGRDRRDALASRRRRWAGPGLAAAVALLLLGGGRLAPVPVEAALPDFSGTWAYEPPAAADDPRAVRVSRPPTGVCAARCTIIADAGTITVTRHVPGDVPTTLQVDGVERRRLYRNPVSGQDVDGATRAAWEDGTLAIQSAAAAPHPGQARTTLSLVDARLVIESVIDLNGRRTRHRFTYRRVQD